jgi:ubiquitin-like 1-activating enzyme E1 B
LAPAKEMPLISTTLRIPKMVPPYPTHICSYHATTDTVVAEEIANLQKEAQALKKIRETMGTDDFAKKVFDKVFTDDIERLRGMEDMWKSRTAPVPLIYAQLSQDASTVDAEISSNDQNVWSLVENFAMFRDR